MELRPYQKEAKEAVFEQWGNGTMKTLLVLPTGCGKTIVFAKITEDCVSHGDRVLILAHRGELLDQAADKIAKATGLGCATEKAEQSCLGSWFRITVGSVQSLMRETRLNRFPEDYFNTIIIDEAHHCISDSYQRVLKHFPDAKILVAHTGSFSDYVKSAEVATSQLGNGADILTGSSQQAIGALRATAESPTAMWVGQDLAQLTTTEGQLKCIAASSYNYAAVVKELVEKIESGWNVFSGPIHGVAADGTEINLAEGEEFVEPLSAPSWTYIVDGIEVIE